MSKILIFGECGFLAQRLLATWPEATGSSVDIADPQAVRAELKRRQPEVVINCAGKTGRPNIDWCETHQRETLRSNVTGALVVADACLADDLFLVHLSSGCVYQGDANGEGYSETDAPNFFGSYYARTKILTEEALREFPVLILRPRMPFDMSLHSRTLIGKLLHYDRVLDAENSLTFLPDFVEATRVLIDQRATGIVNMVNPGTSSPYTIMQRYRQLVDSTHKCDRLDVAQLGEVATAARSNCVLSIDKLLSFGVAMRPVSVAIEESLKRIADARAAGELTGPQH